MKVSLCHVPRDGADPDGAGRVSSPIESESGHGGDVHVGLHPAGDGQGPRPAHASGDTRSAAGAARATPQAQRCRRDPRRAGSGVIVLDASALVELLLNTPAGHAVATRIADPALGLHVPHLADVEVAQAFRRYTRTGELDAAAGAAALEDLRSLDLQRHSHEPLLERVWELRE